MFFTTHQVLGSDRALRRARQLGCALTLGLAALGAAQAGVVQLSNWALYFGQVDPRQGGIVTLQDFGDGNGRPPIAAFQVQLAGFGDGQSPVPGWLRALEGSDYQFEAVDLAEVIAWPDGSLTYYSSIGKGSNIDAPTFAGPANYGIGIGFYGTGLLVQTPNTGNPVPEPGSASLILLALLAAAAAIAGVRPRPPASRA